MKAFNLNVQKAVPDQKFTFKPACELGGAHPQLPMQHGMSHGGANMQGLQIPQLVVKPLETPITVIVDGIEHEAKLSGVSKQVFVPSLNRTVSIYGKSNPGGCVWKPRKN